MNLKQNSGYLLIGFILIALDQSLKIWAMDNSHYFINQGVAFSLFASWGLILNLLGLVIFFSLLYLYRDFFFQQTADKLAVIFISAGGLSNLFDRIFRGGVVDFLSFPSVSNFNLADVFVNIGCILFIMRIIIASLRKNANLPSNN